MRAQRQAAAAAAASAGEGSQEASRGLTTTSKSFWAAWPLESNCVARAAWHSAAVRPPRVSMARAGRTEQSTAPDLGVRDAERRGAGAREVAQHVRRCREKPRGLVGVLSDQGAMQRAQRAAPAPMARPPVDVEERELPQPLAIGAVRQQQRRQKNAGAENRHAPARATPGRHFQVCVRFVVETLTGDVRGKIFVFFSSCSTEFGVGPVTRDPGERAGERGRERGGAGAQTR